MSFSYLLLLRRGEACCSVGARLDSPSDSRAVADDLRQDVRLTQDEDVLGADLDLGPAVLGEDDLVTLLDVHLDVVPVLVARAGAGGENLAALRLLLRRVGQYDPADRLLFFLEDLDDQAVAQRLQIHSHDLPQSEFVTCLALSVVECQSDDSIREPFRQAGLSLGDSDLVKIMSEAVT